MENATQTKSNKSTTCLLGGFTGNGACVLCPGFRVCGNIKTRTQMPTSLVYPTPGNKVKID